MPLLFGVYRVCSRRAHYDGVARICGRVYRSCDSDTLEVK